MIPNAYPSILLHKLLAAIQMFVGPRTSFPLPSSLPQMSLTFSYKSSPTRLDHIRLYLIHFPYFSVASVSSTSFSFSSPVPFSCVHFLPFPLLILFSHYFCCLLSSCKF